ncbi:angiogenic factor with G patch and FHA domains 1-like isoform X2 [Achroia grisella]|uniref:angiogenic factor with G patch and FHA domains 1-like isoform X2 n=1 Tax=Achroia grisella TaxID=688607 RepID=UPI0027D246EE|nr:angiogenic factor with G patch and FHA domains 1-like isoform X2 [Achroia grisella]
MNITDKECERGFARAKKTLKKFNMRQLRIALKYRPEILKLILKMRMCIKRKNLVITKLKHSLLVKNGSTLESSIQTDELTQISTKTSDENILHVNSIDAVRKPLKDSYTQTLDSNASTEKMTHTIKLDNEEKGWSIAEEKGESEKSIADQVKEVAQSALQESGMVYVETAGMYYDYKTGYYYNPELGLYYHTNTECYYYYSEDKKTFVFHSYPDRSASNPALEAHEKKKAKKQKRDKEEDATNKASKTKRRKILKKKKESHLDQNDTANNKNSDDREKDIFSVDETEKDKKGSDELEDGECSESDCEKSENEDNKSNASTSTATDDESVAKHHPPCMRVIVKDTNLPKLKVGSLFLITKDGGTIGREGDQHVILIKDHNISRTHLDIRYDMDKKAYVATDLGSKNGTILNGARMSESQVVSDTLEILHGSMIQLGETKLLCHIHPGTDTCGHCEPGLLMETHEKEKTVAYTRTCSVQKQYQLELARLKNKYAPQPLAIEETAYNDRAQARRETVGSSHHSEKTQSTDVDTFIAPENKGFKLLEKMGWSKGEGLGKDNQGDTEPVPLISNEGKVGLGAASTTPCVPPKKVNRLGSATLRLANRSKMLKPPAKAFQAEDEDSE